MEDDFKEELLSSKAQEYRRSLPSLHTRTVTGSKAEVRTVAWSPDGDHLASSGVDRNVRVTTCTPSGSMRGHLNLSGHLSEVNVVAYNPVICSNGAGLLASASSDQMIKIWDTRAAAVAAQISSQNRGRHSSSSSSSSASGAVGHYCYSVNTKEENINLSWSPDGNQLACASRRDTLFVIDIRKTPVPGQQQQQLQLQPPVDGNSLGQFAPRISAQIRPQNKLRDGRLRSLQINEFRWSRDGQKLAVCAMDGTVRFLATQPELRSLPTSLKAHASNCISMAIDSTGKYMATGGADSLVALWDLSELACVRTIERMNYATLTLGFNHSGDLLASAGEDPVIDIADVQTGALIHSLAVAREVNAVAWHPKRNLLAYALSSRMSPASGANQSDDGLGGPAPAVGSPQGSSGAVASHNDVHVFGFSRA